MNIPAVLIGVFPAVLATVLAASQRLDNAPASNNYRLLNLFWVSPAVCLLLFALTASDIFIDSENFLNRLLLLNAIAFYIITIIIIIGSVGSRIISVIIGYMLGAVLFIVTVYIGLYNECILQNCFP